MIEGIRSFYLGLSHITLSHFYKIVFSLAQHHKWSIADIENLMPYERDLYFDMLIDFIETQNAKQQQ